MIINLFHFYICFTQIYSMPLTQSCFLQNKFQNIFQFLGLNLSPRLLICIIVEHWEAPPNTFKCHVRLTKDPESVCWQNPMHVYASAFPLLYDIGTKCEMWHFGGHFENICFLSCNNMEMWQGNQISIWNVSSQQLEIWFHFGDKTKLIVTEGAILTLQEPQ